jgi:hypothetical protein
VQGWERQFQEILHPQQQPSTSGYKYTPTMHVTPGYMEQTHLTFLSSINHLLFKDV